MKNCLYLVSLILFTACGTSNEQKTEWPVDFEELVDLHCKSIELKDARFVLADSIRFIQDSLLVKGNQGLDVSLFENQLKALENRKQLLKDESYALSDTIENRMKRVIRELSPEEKRVFNDSLIARSKACL